MAFDINHVRILVGFSLQNPAKIFTLYDNSNYAVVLSSTNKIKGAFRIRLNGVDLYNNLADVLTNPDIILDNFYNTRDRSDTQPVPINLPLNPDGSLAKGTYIIDYRVVNEENSEVLKAQSIIIVNHNKVAVNFKHDFSCNPLNPFIKIEDKTTYEIAGMNDAPAVGRLLKIYPQSYVGTTPTSTSSTELILTSFYTVQYIGELVSSAVYNLNQYITANSTNFSYSLTDGFVASAKIDIICDTSLCDLYCSISNFEKVIYNNRTTGNSLYNNMMSNAGLISFYMTLLSNAYNCGGDADVARYIEMIKSLVGKKCGGCGKKGEPVLIRPINAPYANTGKVIRYVSQGEQVLTFTELIAKTYTNDFQDFIVFSDGIKQDVTFVSSTGTIDFGYSTTIGTLIEIVWLR